MILLLWGITLVTWCLTNLVPADPAAIALGPQASSNPQLVQEYRVKFGLNKPLPEQYLIYIGHLLEGNLGTSIITTRPVIQDLKQYVPATAELAFFACLFGFTGGIVLGTWSALRKDKLADHIIRIFACRRLCARVLACVGRALLLLPPGPRSGRRAPECGS